MTASHDEQTGTDELTTLLHRFLYTFAPDGTVRPNQYVTLDLPQAKAAIEAWSRQQTAQILDGLLKHKVKDDRYGWIIDAHFVADKLEAIEALRVGLEG